MLCLWPESGCPSFINSPHLESSSSSLGSSADRIYEDPISISQYYYQYYPEESEETDGWMAGCLAVVLESSANIDVHKATRARDRRMLQERTRSRQQAGRESTSEWYSVNMHKYLLSIRGMRVIGRN